MIYGRADPQDIPAVTACRCCGQEIYAGETVYVPNEVSGFVCEDCARDWLWGYYSEKLGKWAVMKNAAK